MYKLNEFCVKRTKCVLLLYYTLSLRLGHLYTAQTNSSLKRIVWKRSSNWRSLKTWALGFRVDGTELFKNDGVAIIKCFPDRVFLKVKSLRFYLKFIWCKKWKRSRCKKKTCSSSCIYLYLTTLLVLHVPSVPISARYSIVIGIIWCRHGIMSESLPDHYCAILSNWIVQSWIPCHWIHCYWNDDN